MNTEETKQQDFEGRKYAALMGNTEAVKVFGIFECQQFTYRIYRQPAHTFVCEDPALDWVVPEHFMLLIQFEGKNVVTLRAATLELAKKDVSDRIAGMLEFAFC